MDQQPKSGLEALIAALSGSGFDMNDFSGKKSRQSEEAEIADEVDAVFEEGSSDSSTSRGGSHRKQGRSGGAIPKITFIENMAEWSKKRLILAAVVAVLALAAAYWWFHPPINIHSGDTWFVILLIMAFLWMFLRVRSRNFSKGTKNTQQNSSKAHGLKIASYVPVAVVIVFLLGSITSLSLFPGNAEKYSSILTIENEDITEDIKEVNYSEIPIIDRSTAELLGNK